MRSPPPPLLLAGAAAAAPARRVTGKGAVHKKRGGSKKSSLLGRSLTTQASSDGRHGDLGNRPARRTACVCCVCVRERAAAGFSREVASSTAAAADLAAAACRTAAAAVHRRFRGSVVSPPQTAAFRAVDAPIPSARCGVCCGCIHFFCAGVPAWDSDRPPRRNRPCTCSPSTTSAWCSSAGVRRPPPPMRGDRPSSPPIYTTLAEHAFGRPEA